MRVRISAFLFACVIIATAPTVFAETQSADIVPTVQQELYLDVALNQSAQTSMGHFLQKDQQLYIDVTSLKRFSIQTDAIPMLADQVSYVALNQIKGLSYHYDDLNQKFLFKCLLHF